MRFTRGICNWNGTIVKGRDSDVHYSAFCFAPATGRHFDQGIINAPAGEFQSKGLPSPQEWVLVLERRKR